MNYNFDRLCERRGSGCFKYDTLKMIYGKQDLIPLWVADMDFPVAPPIQSALQKRLDHGIFGYNFRLPLFYETVLNWVQKQYGISAAEDWILSSPGVMPAVSLAVTVAHLTWRWNTDPDSGLSAFPQCRSGSRQNSADLSADFAGRALRDRF